LKFLVSLTKLISSFFSQNIQSFGGMWNAYAKWYTSMGARRFRLFPRTVQHIFKWNAPNT
jgi:hypothetical protein